jgi:hypothetical protein
VMPVTLVTVHKDYVIGQVVIVIYNVFEVRRRFVTFIYWYIIRVFRVFLVVNLTWILYTVCPCGVLFVPGYNNFYTRYIAVFYQKDYENECEYQKNPFHTTREEKLSQ